MPHAWDRPRGLSVRFHLNSAILFLCVSFPAVAAQQHISFEDDEASYEVTFDDQRISMAQMRDLVLLSPFLLVEKTGGRLSFTEEWRHDAPEDRQLAIAPLEACKSGEENCGGTAVDEAFLVNAARNLKEDKERIRDLEHERVPKVLKPVRSYLVDQAQFLLKLQEARYAYFQKKSTAPLRKRLCEACPCSVMEASILDNLRDAPAANYHVTDPWYNRAVGCHEALNLKYPVEAWRQFVRQYGIVEHYRLKPGR